MSWVGVEKAALVETFRDADPDAATLDEGWDVRRLLAHLVQREQAPVAMITDALARRPPGQEPGLSRLTDRARSEAGYARLLERFVAGAPRWSPMSWAGEQLSFLEYVIHHEDVRRAGPEPAEPRELGEDEQDAVWKQLGLFALALRRAPVGIRLETPRGQSREARRGEGVTLRGEPVELALWTSGRRSAAHVDVTGPAAEVARFHAWAAAS